MRTEEILLGHMKKIFKIYHMEEAAVISVTRSADISFDGDSLDEEAPDFRSQMEKLLRLRKRLAPVRLELQGEAPRLLEMLRQKLRLEPRQCFASSCPLKLGYAYQLEGPPKLFYPPFAPAWPEWLSREEPIWDQVCQRDISFSTPTTPCSPSWSCCASQPRIPGSSPSRSPSTGWQRIPPWSSTSAPPPRTARTSPPWWSCGPL